MGGVFQHLVGRSLFDDPAGVHHGHPVGHLPGDPDVVGDEQGRHAEPALELADQFEDLGLDTTLLERADRLDPVLGTYIVRFDEAALSAAAALDAELAAGVDRGPLHGVPLGIKDIIATDDGPTTAQSLILDPAWGSQGDAPVVKRLRAV
jgi:hypothetical protein